MIGKIYAKDNYIVFEDSKGTITLYNRTSELKENSSQYQIQDADKPKFVVNKAGSNYEDDRGVIYNDETLRAFVYANTGFKRALGSGAVAELIKNNSETGYSHTGAFAGKPTSNQYVWEAGVGIDYTLDDVSNGLYKTFSLDHDVHLAVDNPYWRSPDPTKKGIGLFEGEHLPGGVSSLVDYTFDYNENISGNSNFLLNSERLDIFDASSPFYTAELTDSVGPNGTSAVWRIKRETTGGYSTFNNPYVYVSENTTYFLKFKVRNTETEIGSYSKTRVRDQSNGQLLVPAQTYFMQPGGDWVEVSTEFTTPAGCSQVQVSLSAGENLVDIEIAEVQVSTSDSSIYLPTGNEAINNGVTHQYYALDGGTATGYEDAIGRLKLNDLKVGDQLRVRFEFNAIPKHENTTIEPALWYSNRNSKDEITFSFALTAQPIFFGVGTAGKTFLNRPELSAWIASEEDINALCLPAIKSDQSITIQPLGMLITIIR